MNLSLQDPFAVATEYPDTLETVLHHGHSLVIRFSHKGDYLASGEALGSIVIYDLMASGAIIAIIDSHHTRAITSLSWSSCGRYILSSSQDCKCILWDLSLINALTKESPAIRVISFDSPIWLASMHPSKYYIFTASLVDSLPVHVDLSDPDAIRITDLEAENQLGASTLVTAFSPVSGEFIFTGTSKGVINVFDAVSLKLCHTVKATSTNIKSIVFLGNGKQLVVNLSDRIIRQYSVPEPTEPVQWDTMELTHKYQDVVNRLQWNGVLINHNGDFLAASAYGTSLHDMYVWETSLGQLIKILEGSPEELADVQWNARRCAIGATGIELGMIYLWQVQFPQKWSALAPDFVEVEESIEYIEREDEFDVIEDAKVYERRLQEEEGKDVDVCQEDKEDARGFERLDSLKIPVKYR